MSNYQKGDIVEFFNSNNQCEFGVIISVQISDTISALVVSGFAPNHPQWIPTWRVKNHWKNLKGYISDIDVVKEENAELRYIVEQFFNDWYCEDGCPKQKDKNFPCHGEEENETTTEFYPGECSWYQTKCWVDYYRWKYRQFCVKPNSDHDTQTALSKANKTESEGKDDNS